MSKPSKFRPWVFALALVAMVGIILYAGYADAACKPTDYGCADFSERRAFPQDGKCIDFNNAANIPGGDILNGAGDLESWDGTHGTCTDCPTGAGSCNCNGTSDLAPDTTTFYSGNTAAKVTTDASNNSVSFAFTVALEPDTAYLLTFWTKGSDGTEDMVSGVQTSSQANRYYVGSTDTWQAGYSAAFVNSNMGTAWTKRYGYVLTDAVDRSSTSISITRNGASQTWYVDDIQLHKLPKVAYYTLRGAELWTPLVDADQGLECSGAVGCYATVSDDHIEFAHDDSFSPGDGTGSWSVAGRYTTDDITQSGQWFFNYGTDWYVYLDSGNDSNILWQDITGGSDSLTNASTRTQNGAWGSFAFAYDFQGDATSDAWMLTNNDVEVSTATAEGPVRDNGLDHGLGGRADNGGQPMYGNIGIACYWDRALSSVERNQFNNPFFGKTNRGDGFTVNTCTQAATHNVCGDDGCVLWDKNSCWPDQRSMPVFDQYTIELDNTDLESWGANAPTGWTRALAGTGTLTQYFGDSFDGDSSVRLKGVDGDTARMYTDCITAPAGNDTTIRIARRSLKGWSKGTSDHGLTLRYTLYDGGACTNTVSTSAAVYEIPHAGWDTQTLTVAAADWGANTGIKFHVWARGSGESFDYLVDAINITESSYPVPYTTCAAGSGTCTFNRRTYTLDNPLLQESDQAVHYEDGFCYGTWFWTAWAQDGVQRYILMAPGTAGNNNRWNILHTSSDNLQFTLYDSAGASKVHTLGLSGSNWSANGWKYIEVCSDNTGTTAGRLYDMTLNTWTALPAAAGAGSGVQDGAAAAIYPGQYNSGGYEIDGWIDSLALCPYASPFPKCGWGEGPPQYEPY